MLIPDYHVAVKCIFRVLRRDGQVAITAWKSQGHWDYLVRAARQVFRDKSYPPPRFFDDKWLSGDYIANILARSGFRYLPRLPLIRRITVHEKTHMWAWSSKESFVAFVGRNTAPVIQRYMAEWSHQQKEEVVMEIFKILDIEFPGRDAFTVPMVANIVVGCKR